jgi:hypothetical protein
LKSSYIASVPRHISGYACRVAAVSAFALLSLIVLHEPSTADSVESSPPTVVLISMDGTRPADLTVDVLPSLVDLGRRGARAAALVTVNPSNTFPAHVSLVTGVRPEVHRLVNNGFIDPIRGRFDRDDAHLWIESEPIWSIAERHGIPTASYYWVASEGPWAGGPGPRSTRKFSSRTQEKTKVDRILKWLALEEPDQRPRLITTWFHGADHSAHVDGPGADSLAEDLAPQDAAIARLIREMEERQLFRSTTLIFVSDHGMAAAPKRVNLSRKLGRARLGVSVIGIGGFAMIVFDEGRKTLEATERAVAIAREQGLEAWPREKAPESWHVDDPRFGDVVVRAPLGTAIVTSFTRIDGYHGYDAKLPEMAGILLAYGRGVEAGTSLGTVSSLAVAPTVLRLLGLPIPETMTTPPIEELLPDTKQVSSPISRASGGQRESGDTPSR